MYKVEESTLNKAFKPFDIVSDKHGNVGFITEVSVNDCQQNPGSQISYSVDWLVGSSHNSWYAHRNLISHCNLFVKIAEATCNGHGHNNVHVKRLLTGSKQ